MNTRYFDHKIHANSSARKMLMALRNNGGDTKGLMADQITDRILLGLLTLSMDKQKMDKNKKDEILQNIFETIQLRNRSFKAEEFDEAVSLLALSFKEAGMRNDYQFFWNMLKEAMYCVEEDVKEKYNIHLEASTLAYHLSNKAKETVGATGLKYASDQVVF